MSRPDTFSHTLLLAVTRSARSRVKVKEYMGHKVQLLPPPHSPHSLLLPTSAASPISIGSL